VKTVVTGGCRFIGAHLCAHLIQQGKDVVAVDDLGVGSRLNLGPSARQGSTFRPPTFGLLFGLPSSVVARGNLSLSRRTAWPRTTSSSSSTRSQMSGLLHKNGLGRK
jgi:hypothetical protein